jgi:hypothetical protein
MSDAVPPFTLLKFTPRERSPLQADLARRVSVSRALPPLSRSEFDQIVDRLRVAVVHDRAMAEYGLRFLSTFLADHGY